MIQKKCLKCGKDFKAEKDTAKYCSVSCRVMYNRNNRDKERVSAEKSILLQTQVALNSLLEAVGKINYGVVPTSFDGKKNDYIKMDEARQWKEPKPTIKKRTPEEWVLWKREILDADEFQEWVKELESADYLTSKQKSLIKQT